MKFDIKNEITSDYNIGFKPYQLRSVVVSANGTQEGLSGPLLSMIDTGAKHTSISSKAMERVLTEVKDENGNALRPVGQAITKGIVGNAKNAPLYILPHLYIDKMHFTNVLVIVPDTNNFECLIGRSILHQCILTCDPKTDMLHFDFDDSLKQHKQKLSGYDVFGEVKLFAEFDEKEPV